MANNEARRIFSHITKINPSDNQRSQSHHQNNIEAQKTGIGPYTISPINNNPSSLPQHTRTKNFTIPISKRESTRPEKHSSPTAKSSITKATKFETRSQTQIARTTNSPKPVKKARANAARYGLGANPAPILIHGSLRFELSKKPAFAGLLINKNY